MPASAPKAARGTAGEALFVELALEDLRRAADLFRRSSTHGGTDGWVSMEVSPLLADDTAGHARGGDRDSPRWPTVRISTSRFRARRPGVRDRGSDLRRRAGQRDLLFSREQYLAVAEAYLRGIERRIAPRARPARLSVASLFVSRWDRAVSAATRCRGTAQSARHRRSPAHLRAHYRSLLNSKRWRDLAAPARASSACSGRAPAPRTRRRPRPLRRGAGGSRSIDTMPEKTLLAFAEAAASEAGSMPDDGGDCEAVLGAQFAKAGIDVDALAAKLQKEGAESFVKSWRNSCSASPTRARACRNREHPDQSAGRQAAPASILVDVPRLITAYYTERPDVGVREQRVAFGTSGHRGSSFDATFNESHVLAITQAICAYRKQQGIDGPLFLGFDTHALSAPAFASALEVLAANGVEVMIAAGDEYTPTPAISHAILDYNRERRRDSRTAS
jgi:hypothetical protein